MKKIVVLAVVVLIGSCNFNFTDPEIPIPPGTPAFSSTEGDGIAEAVYVLSPSETIQAGTQVWPLFYVDSDTGFIKSYIAAENDATMTAISGNLSLLPGAGPYGIPVSVPYHLPAGNYQFAMDLAVDYAAYQAGTFTRYIQSASGSEYWQYYYSGNTLVNSFVSRVAAAIYTVNGSAAVSSQTVACSTSSTTPVDIAATVLPSAFTSTIPASSTCFYRLTMPSGGLYFYSLTLDSMVTDNQLSVFSTNGFVMPSQCLTTASMQTSYNCTFVQSDINDVIYLAVLNPVASPGSFRLLTP